MMWVNTKIISIFPVVCVYVHIWAFYRANFKNILKVLWTWLSKGLNWYILTNDENVTLAAQGSRNIVSRMLACNLLFLEVVFANLYITI